VQLGLDVFPALLLLYDGLFEFCDAAIALSQFIAASGIRRIRGLPRADCVVVFCLETDALGLCDAEFCTQILDFGLVCY
jgi:hypothetical protein